MKIDSDLNKQIVSLFQDHQSKISSNFDNRKIVGTTVTKIIAEALTGTWYKNHKKDTGAQAQIKSIIVSTTICRFLRFEV